MKGDETHRLAQSEKERHHTQRKETQRNETNTAPQKEEKDGLPWAGSIPYTFIRSGGSSVTESKVAVRF